MSDGRLAQNVNINEQVKNHRTLLILSHFHTASEQLAQRSMTLTRSMTLDTKEKMEIGR